MASSIVDPMALRSSVPSRTGARVVGLLAAITLLVATSASCSSGGASCSNLDPCPKDPPLPASEIQQCQQEVSQCPGLQSYLNCAVANIKCKADGTLDSAATTTAVSDNCKSAQAGVTNCSSVTFSNNNGTSCGLGGQACCTTGTACQDGCCDPASKTCVLPMQACSGGTSICDNGSCQACGAAGQPCCNDQCTGGGCCDISAASPTCVAPNALCAPLGSTAQVCGTSGNCTSCGQPFEACCPGATCTPSSPSFSVYCDSTNTCSNCGSLDEPCCPGDMCTGADVICAPSMTGGMPQCTSCGFSQQPCCTSGMPCVSGGACTSGMCM